jgi:hypothetical protein
MECLSVFLLMLFAMAAAIAALANRLAVSRRRRRLFAQLAQRFGGMYDSGGLFSGPRAQLRYGNTAAVVRYASAFGPMPGPALQVRVAWPHTAVRCELVAGGGNYPLRLAWPRIPVETAILGDPFVIAGLDEREVLQLLTAGVKWQLERLQVLGGDPRLYVWIRDGQIVVQKYWPRPRLEPAVQFVQGVLDLYDQCMLAKASGIEFLHPDEAQLLDEVMCNVCGEPIRDDLVYCQRCKTPHHQECWTYAGNCSVFGCRESVYLLPGHGHSPPTPDEPRWPIRKPR